jgi:hypothetical protein
VLGFLGFIRHDLLWQFYCLLLCWDLRGRFYFIFIRG